MKTSTSYKNRKYISVGSELQSLVANGLYISALLSFFFWKN